MSLKKEKWTSQLSPKEKYDRINRLLQVFNKNNNIFVSIYSFTQI